MITEIYLLGVVIGLGMVASCEKEEGFKARYYFIALLSWFYIGFVFGDSLNEFSKNAKH